MRSRLAVNDPLLALRGELLELRQRVDALEQARAGRDQADSTLRVVLASSTTGLPFKVADLLRHAPYDADLTQALREATIQTANELGAWLRDGVGVHEGVLLRRLPRRRWQAVHVAHVTCAEGLRETLPHGTP